MAERNSGELPLPIDSLLLISLPPSHGWTEKFTVDATPPTREIAIVSRFSTRNGAFHGTNEYYESLECIDRYRTLPSGFRMVRGRFTGATTAAVAVVAGSRSSITAATNRSRPVQKSSG